MNRYYGKRRGTVVSNDDPYQLGRLQVSCPDVLGAGRASWAMPSVPYAGDGVGLFAVPPNGANIWIEFEAGNPDYPIWTGCFWAAGQMPVTPAVARTKVFRTDGLTLTADDAPGSGKVTLTVSPPVVANELSITLDSSGIALSNGTATVTLQGPAVALNGDALRVV